MPVKPRGIARLWLPERVAAVAFALEIGALGLRGFVSSHGYFYLDDFVFTARAADHSALSPAHLLQPYNSHLMPGSYLWVWLLTKLFPFDFRPVVVTCLVVSALGAWLFYRLLREMFGSRPAILVPFALMAFSPITLPGTLWWAAAINQLPQIAAMAGVLWCHTLYLRRAQMRFAALAASCLILGLAFSEKTILVVPLVGALTLLCFGPVDQGGLFEQTRRAARALFGHWRAWAMYALVAVPYAAYYGAHVPSPVRDLGPGNSVGQLTTDALTKGLMPGLLGGPWQWRLVGFAGALADPSPFAIVVAGIVVGAIVVVSVMRRQDAWRGWVLVVAYAVVLVATLAVSRASFVGTTLAVEYRYFTDFALVAALGVGLAFIPLAGEWAAGPVVALRARSAGVGRLYELTTVLPRATEPLVVGCAVVALAASSTVSTLSYDQFWRINPARPFISTALTDFEGEAGNLTLADAYVPPDVAWGVLGDYATNSHLFSPMHRPPRTLLDGPADDPIYTLDGSGHVRRAVIQGVSARPGPVKGCGYELGTALQTIDLPAVTTPWVLTLRVGYISGAETRATIVVNSTSSPVLLRRGLNAIYLRVRGPIETVRVGGLDRGVRACTNEVTVGGPVPLAGRL